MDTVKKKNQKKKTEKEQTTGKSFTAIKKSMSDIGNAFSGGADKVTDVLSTNNEKRKNVKQELGSVFKDIASDIKKSLKKVNSKDVLHDVSYELGRFSKIARNTCTEIFEDLME